jgi:phospholipase/carboxylesterase
MRIVEHAGLQVRLLGGPDREGGGDGPLVVLLHGFGAPGDDLIALQRVIPVAREVRFAFPAAPLEPPDFRAFGGRAWWPLDVMALQRAAAEGRGRERTLAVPPGLPEARAQLLTLLDELERDLQVPSGKLILGGFSQGSMLACDLALHSDRALAGLVLFSSTLVSRDEWQTRMPARKGLPILQTHGEFDPLLSLDLAVELRDMFRTAGAQVEWVQFRGGHELPGPVLEAFGHFIARVL